MIAPRSVIVIGKFLHEEPHSDERLATSFSAALSLNLRLWRPKMGERSLQHALEEFSAIASCLAKRRRIGL